ncbi:AMP-binding protein [Herbiconiux moechotypicola]|uniref:O-succinylbenzoate--CoA ligase n=1 Tax=Herbiconiux moechotypicola TaxID=637393 RepID=A0ABN3E079_9MICO|nr:AMP-binding protein [Herbiconiux moechotypicola]MCS5731115.1 AMP-binding protein [Herbiconiux moechotypicola]
MTRPLEIVEAETSAVVESLQRALAHDGPAILPRESSDAEHRSGGALPSEVPGRVALVVETSGSSGAPKRVMLSADALLSSAAATENALGGGGQWLLALPVHYIAGLQVLVRSITAGTAPVVQAAVVHGAGHFSASQFTDLAERLTHPRRYTSLVPAQLARVVEAAETDERVRRAARRFDAVLIGGQALPRRLHERARALEMRVVRTYGSSETAGGCVYDGRPIGSAVVREVGGELQIGGPMLAEGYLGDDELTADRFVVAEGRRWYRTSDGGSVEDGVVAVTGRLDNVIISGGVKVSLDRVERLVQGVPGLESAVVVAAADETWGQVPVVVAESGVGPAAGAGAGAGPGAGAGVDPDESWRAARAAVIAQLGRPAAPAEIEWVPALPRLASGKPDRQSVASWFQGPRD